MEGKAGGLDPRALRIALTGAGLLALVLAAVVASFAYLAVDWGGLFGGESLRLMGKFIAEFFPPDLSPAFLAQAGRARPACC